MFWLQAGVQGLQRGQSSDRDLDVRVAKPHRPLSVKNKNRDLSSAYEIVGFPPTIVVLVATGPKRGGTTVTFPTVDRLHRTTQNCGQGESPCLSARINVGCGFVALVRGKHPRLASRASR